MLVDNSNQQLKIKELGIKTWNTGKTHIDTLFN